MSRILLILKEPFLDRIPSLKTLVWSFLNRNDHITLITSESKFFTLISFQHKNLRVIKVKQRSRKIEISTSIKLFISTFNYLLFNSVDYVIGGDALGNIIASRLCQTFKKKHIFFVLEYPQIPTSRHPHLSHVERAENKALCHADVIITHDKWHEAFLRQHFAIRANNVLHLPNASFTPEFKGESDFLQQSFHLQDTTIILHSGGFGIWFKCKELAECTRSWDDNVKLVFHLSHDLMGSPYFEEIYHNDYHGKILWSLKPVSTFELDKLVASASIGIALYSEQELGYRATYMGLAAGKIGNYLKCGVPVIATRLPSLTYLEEFECGILVDNEADISHAIQKIILDRETDSSNAYKCYSELWHPDRYIGKIYAAIK